MTKRGLGLAVLVLGLLMVAASLVLTSMYEKREAAAGYNAEMLMHEFAKRDEFVLPLVPAAPASPAEQDEESELPVPEMARDDYYGLPMLGVIRVPDCNIELPVLDDWNMWVLDYAPCRYSGNIYSGDFVVMGHNYTTHFKPLKKVEIGAAVEFESVDGTVWRYTVDEIDSVHRDQPAKLPSEHELILFTCEEYGVYRFVARCSLVE